MSSLLTILNDLEELSQEEKAQYFLNLETVDPALARRARALDDMPSDFLEQPIQLNQNLEAEFNQLPDLSIQKFLGEGGMGRVYLARQEGKFKRDVALKVLPNTFHSESMERFRTEYNALAKMDHHHIARLYDVGETPRSEHPYFLMEYVEGPQLGIWCEREKPDLKKRLELFLQICEGVTHAHQKGILHRDLKPNNILVQRVEGKEMIKIIDFGIARTIEPKENSFQTQLGQRIGTPAFMSPEQLQGRTQKIDTRSDIYGLGAVLFHLLTGEAPHAKTSANSPSQFALAEKVSTQEPPRPGSIATHLSKDLDAICVKAMAVEQDHRYATVVQLMEDINRYLEARPVLARKGNTAYVTRRFLARHRIPVSIALIVFSALAMVLIERQRSFLAQQQQLEAERTKSQTFEFLERTLAQSESRYQGRNISLLEALRVSYEQILNRPMDGVGAKIARLYGKALSSHGIHDQAEDALCHARLYFEAHPESNAGEYLKTLEYLALLAERKGEQTRAEALYYQIWCHQEATREQKEFAKRSLATLQRRRNPILAVDLFHDSVTYYMNTGQMREGMTALRRQAISYRNLGQTQLANGLLDQVLDWQERNMGRSSFDSLRTRLSHQSRHSEQYLHELVALANQALGPEDLLSQDAQLALAGFQIVRNTYDDHTIEALVRIQSYWEPKHARRLRSDPLLAQTSLKEHKALLYWDLLERFPNILDEPEHVLTVNNLANSIMKDEPTTAIALLSTLLQIETLSPGDRSLIRITLAEAYIAAGDFSSARFELEKLCLDDPRPKYMDAFYWQAAKALLENL